MHLLNLMNTIMPRFCELGAAVANRCKFQGMNEKDNDTQRRKKKTHTKCMHLTGSQSVSNVVIQSNNHSLTQSVSKSVSIHVAPNCICKLSTFCNTSRTV